MGTSSRGRTIRVHFIYLSLRLLCFHGNFGYKFLSAHAVIGVSFNVKEASLFQGLVLRVAEIIEDSAPSLIYSFQFIIF